MMTLFIDSSASDATYVALAGDGTQYEKRQAIGPSRSQVILPLIEKLLEESHKTFADISDIQVAVGPGSFTGTRVGITIAQTLGVLLGVPVNGLAAHSEIVPVYEK